MGPGFRCKHHEALGNIRVPYNGYLFGITRCLSIASVCERQNQFYAEFATEILAPLRPSCFRRHDVLMFCSSGNGCKNGQKNWALLKAETMLAIIFTELLEEPHRYFWEYMIYAQKMDKTILIIFV